MNLKRRKLTRVYEIWSTKFIDMIKDRLKDTPYKFQMFLNYCLQYTLKKIDDLRLIEGIYGLIKDHADLVEKFRVGIPLELQDEFESMIRNNEVPIAEVANILNPLDRIRSIINRIPTYLPGAHSANTRFTNTFNNRVSNAPETAGQKRKGSTQKLDLETAVRKHAKIQFGNLHQNHTWPLEIHDQDQNRQITVHDAKAITIKMKEIMEMLSPYEISEGTLDTIERRTYYSSFVYEVNKKYSTTNPGQYLVFLNILKDYLSREINYACALLRIREHFKNNSELEEMFCKAFGSQPKPLPVRSKIEFLVDVKNALYSDKKAWLYEEFVSLMSNEVNYEDYKFPEFKDKVCLILEDYPKLILEFNNFLPPEKYIPVPIGFFDLEL